MEKLQHDCLEYKGSQVNNCYQAMSQSYMTAICQAILSLSLHIFVTVMVLVVNSFGLMTFLTLNYLTLNTIYLSLIVVGTYNHFASRYLANLRHDEHIYFTGIVRNIHSFAMFLQFHAICILLVSMVGSHFQAKRIQNIPRQWIIFDSIELQHFLE